MAKESVAGVFVNACVVVCWRGVLAWCAGMVCWRGVLVCAPTYIDLQKLQAWIL